MIIKKHLINSSFNASSFKELPQTTGNCITATRIFDKYYIFNTALIKKGPL